MDLGPDNERRNRSRGSVVGYLMPGMEKAVGADIGAGLSNRGGASG